MFGKTRSLLSCPKIPEEERLRTFYSTVVPCVLWGSGCWIPSAKIQQLLSFQENRWHRCMLGGRKTQDVAWVDWFRTTKRITHALRCKMNLPSLWHRALAAMYGWAGHVARKDNSHPGHAAILWRNVRWWEIMKSIGAGSRDHSWTSKKETGFAVLSMVCPRFWASTGGRLRIVIAAVGKKASISSFVMLFGVGEGPDLSGKRLLLTVWPVRRC